MKIVRYRKDLVNRAEEYLLECETAEDINAVYNVLSLYGLIYKEIGLDTDDSVKCNICFNNNSIEMLNYKVRREYPIIEELEALSYEYAQEIEINKDVADCECGCKIGEDGVDCECKKEDNSSKVCDSVTTGTSECQGRPRKNNISCEVGEEVDVSRISGRKSSRYVIPESAIIDHIYADIRGIYVDTLIRHGDISSPKQFMYYLNDTSLFLAGHKIDSRVRSTLYSFIA